MMDLIFVPSDHLILIGLINYIIFESTDLIFINWD
jgi:hypothetical protein